MATRSIEIRGAREHNLQNIDVDIPRDRLVVCCGVSGSGKSSLAFDTLFAEGQRRYVESLSTYARNFLGQLDKPAYDSIRGLTPTIAVAQGAASRNPRSTVGTMTEVADFLRVLYARAGVQHCHRCGGRVGRQSAAEIVAILLRRPLGQRFSLLAPIVQGRKGAHKEVFTQLQASGFSRVRVDGEVVRLHDVSALPAKKKHDIDVVVDRLVVEPEKAARLADSVESALEVGSGVVIVAVDGESDVVLSEQNACHICDLSFPELEPPSFSFNSPHGRCPRCDGLGFRPGIDPRRVIPEPSLTLHEGAIEPWKGPLARRDGWTYQIIQRVVEVAGVDFDTPWRELPEAVQHVILYGADGDKYSLEFSGNRARGTYDFEWEGVIPTMERRMRQTTSEQMRQLYLEYASQALCDGCDGSRLRPESAAVRVGDVTLPALFAMSIRSARTQVANLKLEGPLAEVAAELLREAAARLAFLEDVGLGYLSLDRGGATLSGGEAQRIRLASQLGGDLTAVTYVLDEPSIGLHGRDNRRLIATLERLRDLGNTVVVVEHDRETIEAADHVLDFGPGAGALGGHIVFAGPPSELAACTSSITGAYLSGRRTIPTPAHRRAPDERVLRVVGARHNNLKDLTLEIPLGLMVAITGVSGAGKSSLIDGILSPALHNALHRAKREVGAHERLEGVEHLSKIIDVDQSPIGRTPRSNPATYTKVFDEIRKLFAKTADARLRGFKAARFSFNTKGGRCEACKGDGFSRVKMHFLPDAHVPCSVCKGVRFNEATLAVRYREHSIADVLALPITEALELFSAHPKVRRPLQTLVDVGLGYLHLGQPSDTLSGGEAQRIKLSRELSRPEAEHTLYILDEPTTGLHFEDVRRLLGVLDALVEAGNTVLVVEHDLDVVRYADFVIDLGPEGGDEGGWVVASGTPEAVCEVEASHTGRLLRGALAPLDW